MTDTLTRSRRVFGEDHPDTLTAAMLVGALRWSLGDYQGARQLLSGTFTGCRRLVGAAYFLGAVLWSLGDHEQARQLENDTLARSRRVLGEDHYVTLQSASLLGRI